jgi:DNA-directed RNA polymerase subunit RPC12/RpoP
MALFKDLTGDYLCRKGLQALDRVPCMTAHAPAECLASFCMASHRTATSHTSSRQHVHSNQTSMASKMIKVRCGRCKKEFHVDDSDTTARCSCGAMNRIPITRKANSGDMKNPQFQNTDNSDDSDWFYEYMREAQGPHWNY